MTAKTGALAPSQKEEPVKWTCLTCQFVVEASALPFRCPRCGASRVKFVELKDGGAAVAEE